MFEGGPPEFAGRPHRGRRQRRPQMDDRPVRKDPTESGLPADSPLSPAHIRLCRACIPDLFQGRTRSRETCSHRWRGFCGFRSDQRVMIARIRPPSHVPLERVPTRLCGLDALRVRGYRPMVMVRAPMAPVDCPLRSGPRSAKARGPPGSMAPRASAFTGMGDSSWTPPLSGRSFSAYRSWRSWRSSCSPCTKRRVFSRTGAMTPPPTTTPPADVATASCRARLGRPVPG